MVLGGIMSGVTTPLDTLKTRIQSQGIKDYSIMKGMREIYKKEGALGLFSGVQYRMLKSGLHSSLYITIYEWYIRSSDLDSLWDFWFTCFILLLATKISARSKKMSEYQDCLAFRQIPFSLIYQCWLPPPLSSKSSYSAAVLNVKVLRLHLFRILSLRDISWFTKLLSTIFFDFKEDLSAYSRSRWASPMDLMRDWLISWVVYYFFRARETDYPLRNWSIVFFCRNSSILRLKSLYLLDPMLE